MSTLERSISFHYCGKLNGNGKQPVEMLLVGDSECLLMSQDRKIKASKKAILMEPHCYIVM